MDSGKLSRLIERYGRISFRVNKMGEALITDALDEEMTLEQDAVMRYMLDHQPCTSSNLATAFNVEKSAVTAIINRLDKKGFIQRVRSDKDRRIVYLQLTNKGEQFHRECSKRINQVLAKPMSQFDPEEIESFMKTYEKLEELLEEQLREQKGVDE